MVFWGADTEEINRVFHNVFRNIDKINKRLDSIEAQMEITCFHICIWPDWHSDCGEELHLNKNKTSDFSAIYSAGQFIFMHDNRLSPRLGFSQVIKKKYICNVVADQKELFVELKKITDKIAPGFVISPDGYILEPDGETLHSIIGPNTETISSAAFPFREFVEASDTQKRHLNMENFHLQEYEDSYKYPDSYCFKSENFSIWITKDQPKCALNTPYYQAIEERMREKRECNENED